MSGKEKRGGPPAAPKPALKPTPKSKERPASKGRVHKAKTGR
jgi:hypothetical protein